jgi:hypothetical protein
VSGWDSWDAYLVSHLSEESFYLVVSVVLGLEDECCEKNHVEKN